MSCLCKERSSSQCHLCPGHLLSVTVAPQLEAPLAVVGQLCAADSRPVCGTVLNRTESKGGRMANLLALDHPIRTGLQVEPGMNRVLTTNGGTTVVI